MAAEDVNISIGVSVNDDEAYRKLSGLRKSIEQIQKQLNADLKVPSKGGLASVDFQKVYGKAKKEHESYINALNELDQGYANKQRQSAASSLVNAEYKKNIVEREKFAKEQQAIENKSYIDRNKLSTEYYYRERQAGAEFARDSKARWNQIVKDEADSINARHTNIVRLRYALYDVSAAAQTGAQAFNSFLKSTAGAAVDYESAFTPLQRATQLDINTEAGKAKLDELKSSLTDLSTQLPNTFQDISGVAALGSALGIANDDLTSFTENVIKFSSASNVGIEGAAQAFGSLSTLLNVSSDQFDNLGSAIAYVGVNSNATESQIISVAEAISGVTSASNISAQYTVGLSGALASLKVPAEQARGSLTRVFAEVNRAAAGNGDQLNRFANVLGITAAEAKNLAATDMAGFFDKFVASLSTMNAQDITTTLDSLNLADIRVTNTLVRLAGNIDTTTSSIQMANQAYAEGTYLSDAYATKQEDISVRFQELTNSVNNLFATMGESVIPVVGPIIDSLKGIVNVFNALISTPAGQWASGLAISIGAVNAVSLLAVAGATRFAAGLLALQTAAQEASNSNIGFVRSSGAMVASMTANSTSIRGVIGSMLGLNAATNVTAASYVRGTATAAQHAAMLKLIDAQNARVIVSNMGLGGSVRANIAVMQAQLGVVRANIAAMSMLQKVTAAAGWIGIALTAFSLLQTAVEAFSSSNESAFDKSKKAAEDYFGTATGLADAFRQDAASGSAGTITIAISEGATQSINDATDATDRFRNAQDGAASAVNTVGDSITVAYGAASKKALYDMLIASEGFQEVLNSGGLKALGGNTTDYVTAILGDPVHGAENYVNSLVTGINSKLQGRKNQFGMDLSVNDLLRIQGDGSSGRYGAGIVLQRFQDALGLSKEQVLAMRDSILALNPAQQALNGELQASAVAAQNTADAQQGLNNALEDSAASTASASDSLSTYKDNLSKLSNASKALDELGKSIADNGTAFAGALDQNSVYTSGAIANSQALANAIEMSVNAAMAVGMNATNAAVSAVAQSFATMVANGVDAANALSAISAAGYGQYTAALQTASSGAYAGLTNAFNAVQAGSKKAGGAVGGTTKKVRTLTDYANDLKNVWSRAFDIRFSGQQAFDKITSTFNDIASAISDARDEINGLNADVQKLNADRALQEYFLSVAEAYGDTLKAQEIRANLASIDADLINKNKSLAKAQAKTNKTLSGNSDEAIANRAEILGLVGNYQDYIYSLAASGASQETLRAKSAQLKQDFIAQAAQLGYNTAELGVYASAFDDVAVAINNVPRDITVTANTNPAIQALNELNEKANSATAGRTMSVGTNIDYAGLAKFARGVALLTEIERMQAQYSFMSASQKANATGEAWLASIQRKKDQLNSGNFATGGYVSGPGSATSDSIPANLSNGEYVIKAAAVNKYGIGFFDRLNQMQTPHYASGGAVTPASTGMVSLSPEDRALLRSIGGSGDITLAVDGVTLARAVNQGNQTIVATGGRR